VTIDLDALPSGHFRDELEDLVDLDGDAGRAHVVPEVGVDTFRHRFLVVINPEAAWLGVVLGWRRCSFAAVEVGVRSLALEVVVSLVGLKKIVETVRVFVLRRLLCLPVFLGCL